MTEQALQCCDEDPISTSGNHSVTEGVCLRRCGRAYSCAVAPSSKLSGWPEELVVLIRGKAFSVAGGVKVPWIANPDS